MSSPRKSQGACGVLALLALWLARLFQTEMRDFVVEVGCYIRLRRAALRHVTDNGELRHRYPPDTRVAVVEAASLQPHQRLLAGVSFLQSL